MLSEEYLMDAATVDMFPHPARMRPAATERRMDFAYAAGVAPYLLEKALIAIVGSSSASLQASRSDDPSVMRMHSMSEKASSLVQFSLLGMNERSESSRAADMART